MKLIQFLLFLNLLSLLSGCGTFIGRDVIQSAVSESDHESTKSIDNIQTGLKKIINELDMDEKERKHFRSIEVGKLLMLPSQPVPKHVAKRLIIIDGNAKLKRVYSSIVVVSGNLEVEDSGNNIIVCGGNLKLAQDKNVFGGHASLLIVKGRATLEYSRSSKVYAKDGVYVNSATIMVVRKR
jgi:hypothetical protein